MKFVEYADSEMMAIDVANVLVGELGAVLRHQDRALLVVPGGSTPGPIFDSLCAANLDWGRVDVLLSDERWHPEEHPRSNMRLIRERLLLGRAAAANLLPLYRKDRTPAEAAPQLSGRIAGHLPISVMLLGMGADMHTASLFPGAPGLEAALDRHAPILVPVEMPADMAGASEPRISLSAAVMNGAMSKHIVIIGAEKRRAIEAAGSLPPLEAPVAAILADTVVHWADA